MTTPPQERCCVMCSHVRYEGPSYRIPLKLSCKVCTCHHPAKARLDRTMNALADSKHLSLSVPHHTAPASWVTRFDEMFGVIYPKEKMGYFGEWDVVPTPDEVKSAISSLLLEERESAAAIVEGWHIKKGGYTELAHLIRKGKEV